MIKKVPDLQLLADFLFLPHYNIPYFNLLHACGGCIPLIPPSAYAADVE